VLHSGLAANVGLDSECLQGLSSSAFCATKKFYRIGHRSIFRAIHNLGLNIPRRSRDYRFARNVSFKHFILNLQNAEK
jgi:hypothetical protein